MKTSIRTVLDATCEYYQITPVALFERRSKRYNVSKRQVFYFMCCKWTSSDLTTIGNAGMPYSGRGQDHSTIIYSRGTVEGLIWSNNIEIIEACEYIGAKIENSNFAKISLVITNVNLLAGILT